MPKSIYLAVSEDTFLIKQAISRVIEESPNQEIIHYDLKEVTLERVIEDLNTYNLFVNKKVIIAENAYFLSSEKPRNVIEQNSSILEEYVKNPSQTNTLFITTNKLDERKSIVKLLHKNATLLNLDLNFNNIIDNNLENFQMDNGTKSYLIERVGNNLEKVLNELEKLKLYRYNEGVITKEDIDTIVTKTIDDNVFELIDAIINRKKKKAFEIYESMCLTGEPYKILILLASRIRLLYQVKLLSSDRDEEIAKIIGSHPYPVKLAREKIYSFSEAKLKEYLLKLANIDIAIKTGKTYQNIALEEFILSI